MDSSQHAFLQSGRLSEIHGEIQKVASRLRGETTQESLQRIIEYIRNFKFYDLEGLDTEAWKKTFLQRSASQILSRGVSYGCDDHTILFVTLARAIDIPAKYITAKRINSSGMHAWPQIYIEKRWVHINATTGEMPFDYKHDVNGPYLILSRSLDPSDSVMKDYQDWIQIEKKFGRIIAE